MSYLIDVEGQDIIIADNDAPYHFLRIMEFAEKKRQTIQYLDEKSYYPTGYVAHWPPGFDFIIGCISRCFYIFHPNTFDLKIWISFIPSMIGILNLYVFYRLSRFCLTQPPSLASMALLSVLPVHITTTYFSIIDHHGAEFLILIGLYWSLLQSIYYRNSLWLAVVIVIGFLSLPSFLLDYIILMICCITIQLTRLTDNHYEFTRILAISQIMALLILIPSVYNSYYGMHFGITYLSLSYFHVCIVGIGSAVTLSCYILDYRLKINSPFFLKLFTFVGIIGFALTCIPHFFQELHNGIAYTRGLFYKDIVNEFQSISWEFLNAGILKGFWPFMICGTLILPYWAWRTRSLNWVILTLPLFFYGLIAFREVKFFRYYQLLAIIPGIGFAELLWMYAVQKKSRELQISLWVLFIGVTLFGLSDFSIAFSLNRKGNDHTTYKMLKFISNTYSVTKDGQTIFANWDIGHKIRFYTDFSNMCNPLLEPALTALQDYVAFNFTPDTAKALSLLDHYDARLVILEPALSFLNMLPLNPQYNQVFLDAHGQPTIAFIQTLNGHLFYFNGSVIIPKTSQKVPIIPAISTLRLVYETDEQIEINGLITSRYRVFEQVPGALVKIQVAPSLDINPELFLNLRLISNTGRQFTYTTKLEKKELGLFQARVPYSAPGKNGSIIANQPYYVQNAGKEIPVTVSEEAIQYPVY